MPTDSAAHRRLPHLRRVALARDTETGDAQFLGSFVASHDEAAFAAAAGMPVGLPVPVVQLSERVMRMFVLNKLKAVVTGVVSCLAVLAGLGLVAGPALRADPEVKPTKPTPAAKVEPARPDPHKLPSDDLTFLRRTSLDLRGVLPTSLEAHDFVADKDPKKREKLLKLMAGPASGRRTTTPSWPTPRYRRSGSSSG